MGNSYKIPRPKTPLPPKGKLQTYKQSDIINADRSISRVELKIMIEMIKATATNLCCENKIRQLAKKIEVSERQLQRCIKSLVQKNYLIVEKRPNKGSIFILGNKLRSEMPTFEEIELREQELIEEAELRQWKMVFESICELCPEGRQTWVTMTTEELQHEIRALIFDDAEYQWGVFREGDRTYMERVNKAPKSVVLLEYQGLTEHQAQCEQVNKHENDIKKDVFTADQGFTSARGDILNQHLTGNVTPNWTLNDTPSVCNLLI